MQSLNVPQLLIELYIEIIKHSDYQEIIKLGSSNNQMINLCRNPVLQTIIQNKKVIYESEQTDIFLKQKHFFNDPLQAAMDKCHDVVIDELLRRGYDTMECYIVILGPKHLNVLKRLLKHPRFNTPEMKGKFLRSSVNGKILPSFMYLIQDPDITSEWKNQSFLEAAFVGQFEMFNVLYNEPLVNINTDNGEAFTRALNRGYVDIINLLLSDFRFRIPKINNRNILHLGSYMGKKHIRSFYDVIHIPQIWNTLTLKQRNRVTNGSFEEEIIAEEEQCRNDWKRMTGT